MPELDKMCERRRGGEMKSVKVLVWHGGHRRLKKKRTGETFGCYSTRRVKCLKVFKKVNS